ncbi:MAG: PucR family transcriptional regulator [Catenulispora sp.]
MTRTQNVNISAQPGAGLAAVARVRRESSSIAAEAAAAICGPAVTTQGSNNECRRRAVAVAEQTVARVLAIVEGRPEVHLPLGENGLRLEQAGTVRSFATAQTWHALLRAASVTERRQLLQSAERVFRTESDGGAQPAAAFGADAREALARALIRQEEPGPIAAAAGIRLADGYLVMAFGAEAHAGSGRRRTVPGQPGLRQDVLVTEERGHTVALIPLAGAVPRSRARALAERSLRGIPQIARRGVVALAQAAHRRAVAAAVDETSSVLQVVDLLDYPAGIYQVDDVPIEMSLMRSPDLASLLATRLAPLQSSGAPLIETLKVYLDTVQDRKQTASILHIHPNTLDYRLRRIRELTGLSPNAPRDIQTLGAALAAWMLADVVRGTTVEPLE